MSAFFTFKLEIHSRACYEKILAAAGMRFFHSYHITDSYIHRDTSCIYNNIVYHIRSNNINDNKEKIISI